MLGLIAMNLTTTFLGFNVLDILSTWSFLASYVSLGVSWFFLFLVSVSLDISCLRCSFCSCMFHLTFLVYGVDLYFFRMAWDFVSLSQ